MKNLVDLFDGLLYDKAEDDEDKLPPFDLCSCSECGWEGSPSDCERVEESEGWEYPSYWIEICPVCKDGGCIEDYGYTPAKLIEANNYWEQRKLKNDANSKK